MTLGPLLVRDAQMSDIPAMHAIRLAVKENQLTDPMRISEGDYRPFIGERGRGWVAEIGGRMAGFAIVDLADRNVWALFIHPDFEGCGAGRALHDRMIDWSAAHAVPSLWLSTGEGTRAQRFYEAAGWTRAGPAGVGEVRFHRQLAPRVGEDRSSST